MKNNIIKFLSLLLIVGSAASCKKTLDINTDPNAPQYIPAESLLPSVLTQMARGIQYDGAYLGRYIQNWNNGNAADIFDRHGWIVPAAFEDPAGEIWRMQYYAIGKNIINIYNDAVEKKKWDYAGVAAGIRAWGWQNTTNYHGEIILKQAFEDGRYTFNYDNQEDVYNEVKRLCLESISFLKRTDGVSSQANLAKGDIVYAGDKNKWLKFTYGILARHYQSLANKSGYNADSAIYYATLALGSNADDFLVPFTGTASTNANFYGASYTLTTGFDRNRQSRFIVNLMDGTTFAGNNLGVNRDPRIRKMLARSADSTGTTNGGYRGLIPGDGDPFISSTSGANARRRVAIMWGDSIYARPALGTGKYLFKDDAKFPIMTYAEMQFIIAEANWKKGDKVAALNAYRNGIGAHIDFVNQFAHTPIAAANVTATEKAAYLANAGVVKNSSATLTLQDIMLQKYIALWGWGFVETWNDMRRYHYTDADANGQVYKGFVLPTTFFIDNNNKPAYRFRPRWNSEYIWNRAALESIGALAADYHTKEMWFTQP